MKKNILIVMIILIFGSLLFGKNNDLKKSYREIREMIKNHPSTKISKEVFSSTEITLYELWIGEWNMNLYSYSEKNGKNLQYDQYDLVIKKISKKKIQINKQKKDDLFQRLVEKKVVKNDYTKLYEDEIFISYYRKDFLNYPLVDVKMNGMHSDDNFIGFEDQIIIEKKDKIIGNFDNNGCWWEYQTRKNGTIFLSGKYPKFKENSNKEIILLVEKLKELLK